MVKKYLVDMLKTLSGKTISGVIEDVRSELQTFLIIDKVENMSYKKRWSEQILEYAPSGRRHFRKPHRM